MSRSSRPRATTRERRDHDDARLAAHPRRAYRSRLGDAADAGDPHPSGARRERDERAARTAFRDHRKDPRRLRHPLRPGGLDHPLRPDSLRHLARAAPEPADNQVIVLETDILFVSNAWDLPAGAATRIAELAAESARRGDNPGGRTHRLRPVDRSRYDFDNQKLSEHRAQAVADALAGARPDLTLEVEGFGNPGPGRRREPRRSLELRRQPPRGAAIRGLSRGGTRDARNSWVEPPAPPRGDLRGIRAAPIRFRSSGLGRAGYRRSPPLASGRSRALGSRGNSTATSVGSDP